MKLKEKPSDGQRRSWDIFDEESRRVSRSDSGKGDPAGLQKKEDQRKSAPVDLSDRGSAGVPSDTSKMILIKSKLVILV